ncbi:hypothetical protein [Paenibacillus lautus]|uniref:hypothetical protein n=1 Tax=Paenibacillus lautus TaxID=1401 RepID=UPI002DB61035|nr:hypothetical protein [Paenibacillus lautus]MEC0253633.1 hypothetical protein [Paenibacillus lautus]
MKKVLVITHSEDKTVDYLINKFQDRLKWYRFNANELDKYEINVANQAILIKCSEFEIEAEDVDSLLYRKIVYPDLSDYSSLYVSLLRRDILSYVEGLAEYIGQVCLTRPSILRRSENKIFQLQAAFIEGFSIPDTLITNSSESALEFISKRSSIIKPLSTGVIRNSTINGIIQTNMVDNSRPIRDISLEPSYFQEYTQKDGGEYRVTFINKEHFAVKIESDNHVDWRKKGSINRYKVVELPNSIIQKCFKLMERLGLSFGAFDFIYTGSEFYFLEVNPNGQWLWLEMELGLSISEGIVSFLENGGER